MQKHGDLIDRDDFTEFVNRVIQSIFAQKEDAGTMTPNDAALKAGMQTVLNILEGQPVVVRGDEE